MRARHISSGVPTVTPIVLAVILCIHAAVKTLVFSRPFLIHVALPIEWASGWAVTGVSVAGALSWLLVVGVGMMGIGRLRPRHLGLTMDAVQEALPILLWVWILLQVPQAIAGLALEAGGLVLPSADVSQAAGRRLQEILGAGLLEEAFYRGFLLIQVFGLLRSRLGRERAMVWAVVASSLYFGLNHIPAALRMGLSTPEAIGYVVQCALVGLLFAGLFLRTGNLFLAAGGHALLNDPLPYIHSPIDPALVTLVGLCTLVLAWPMLARRFSEVFAVGHLEGQPVV